MVYSTLDKSRTRGVSSIAQMLVAAAAMAVAAPSAAQAGDSRVQINQLSTASSSVYVGQLPTSARVRPPRVVRRTAPSAGARNLAAARQAQLRQAQIAQARARQQLALAQQQQSQRSAVQALPVTDFGAPSAGDAFRLPNVREGVRAPLPPTT